MARGGFDYLDDVSKDSGGNKKKLSNLQVNQTGMDESPAEGGEGFVGGNPNASAVGFDYVTGKKGYSESRPIWGERTDNEARTGASDPDPSQNPAGVDSTEEGASWANVDNANGMPRTHMSNEGASSADSSTDSPEDEPASTFGSTEKDPGGFGYLEAAAKTGKPVNESQEAIEPHPTPDQGDESFSDMPQTEYTSSGDGAPAFKRAR
jgi:hypothetical protein